MVKSATRVIAGTILVMSQVAISLGQTCSPAATPGNSSLLWVHPSEDGQRFVLGESRRPITLWGVNYDHDDRGRLLEDYWNDEWDTVVSDFREIKSLGANVVRIHLQLGKFMVGPGRSNRQSLDRLNRLVRLAEDTRLYLDLTGLGCYHRQDVPEWYGAMDESSRWGVQARFWKAVADVCASSPAVFCYDLMNEPILPGRNKPETQWLAGELGGKYFVQRISLDLAGRTREEVAGQWVRKLVSSIREVDARHMVTVGVIPWAHAFPNAKPLFYASGVGDQLDFVSVHFYPKKGEVEKALEALQVYELDKPLVVEEMFPLHCGMDEIGRFVEGSRPIVDGWISFYWGCTAAENRAKGTLQGAIVANWLDWFESHTPSTSDIGHH